MAVAIMAVASFSEHTTRSTKMWWAITRGYLFSHTPNLQVVKIKQRRGSAIQEQAPHQ
jgi:hypothetical protein